MPKFHVTYDTTTPESAEHGDFADCGWLTPGGWRTSSREVCGDAAAKLAAECALSLRDAVNLINTACLEDHGDGFAECDGRTNYTTGEDERRTLHVPDGTTAASYARLQRILGVA